MNKYSIWNTLKISIWKKEIQCFQLENMMMKEKRWSQNLRAKVLHAGPEMLLLTGCVVKEHWRPLPRGVTAILHLARASLRGPGWATRLRAPPSSHLPDIQHLETQEAMAFPNNLLTEQSAVTSGSLQTTEFCPCPSFLEKTYFLTITK